ncbi:uncharacterized protein LOC132164546 [Corylus avellana]|uniref:uncharacterized protein LOC132164546 n=1 Tax=Corylus avellana TaxID=13451 RepID=UPI00286BCE00|nr:uncharacterized protein LOC132164546 [Corylus avellana]
MLSTLTIPNISIPIHLAMDPNSTPFPGKSHPSKPKTTRKPTELPISRQRRVFGTVCNDNVPVITVTQKPTTKPSSGVPQKQPKSTKLKNSPEKAKPRSKKKSVRFPEQAEEKSAENVEAVNVVAPGTPVASPAQTGLKIPGTPYQSAENCSKCRFNRLETSSYWLAQIKLAESVGKHFVSVAFFRLAFESSAEPIRSLRVELKRYLVRHGYLSEQTEWKEVCIGYGLLKDGSNTAAIEESGTRQP